MFWGYLLVLIRVTVQFHFTSCYELYLFVWQKFVCLFFHQMLDRCSDGMAFGALRPCPECGGQLAFMWVRNYILVADPIEKCATFSNRLIWMWCQKEMAANILICIIYLLIHKSQLSMMYHFYNFAVLYGLSVMPTPTACVGQVVLSFSNAKEIKYCDCSIRVYWSLDF